MEPTPIFDELERQTLLREFAPPRRRAVLPAWVVLTLIAGALLAVMYVLGRWT